MEKLDPKINGVSVDIVGQNIQRFKEIFPEAFTEDKVDLDVLREILGDYVDEHKEKYVFAWNGKSNARRIAQTPSTGTLRPCYEESINWDTTQNIFIEGDNLEVLRMLQKSYHKKVKVIYIDPPYNTGNDFIYPDKYQDSLDTYLKYTGQKNSEGQKFSTNSETSGRYHTNWLNMMYPRLKLARNLLREDGAIFISIDDTEMSNLKKLCDELYGEENFIANVVWQKKYAPQNDAKWFSDNHDHILIYSKNKENWRPNLLPRSKEANARYKNLDNDDRGPWKAVDFSRKAVLKHTIYEITLPSGRKVSPPQGRSWLKDPKGFKEMIEENLIWFGPNGDSVPSVKRFLKDVKDGITPLTIWLHSEVGHNQDATKELKALFESNAIFDSPKPVKLLKRILNLSSNSDDIIFDFFAGSATTAHAMFELNIEKNERRRFIIIQLPEPCDINSNAFKAGFKNIADIGKERIRRAGEKIIADHNDLNEAKNSDIGFKVFKLDSSNLKTWDPDFDDLEDSLFDAVYNIKENRTEKDIVYEILLNYGLDLALPIEKTLISNTNVFSVGMGALIICLSSNITIKIIEGIVNLKEKLKPEITRVVFKDSSFKDDVIKTNAIQILKHHGIEDVKSL